MFRKISRSIAAAALLFGLAATATLADSTPATTHYDTAMTQIYGSIAPYSGTMDLHIDASGIVRGYYHPESVTSFIVVTGGVDGKNIWLDIGRDAKIHVSGTLVNGVISGQAINSDDESTIYSFQATPATTDGATH